MQTSQFPVLLPHASTQQDLGKWAYPYRCAPEVVWLVDFLGAVARADHCLLAAVELDDPVFGHL